jgi:tripartite-type tricarboxylate transporter receptor subunit TctC
VSDRAGAGGLISAEIIANSPPDGYTLLISSTGMQVIRHRSTRSSITIR